jgi:hypothetical protein
MGGNSSAGTLGGASNLTIGGGGGVGFSENSARAGGGGGGGYGGGSGGYGYGGGGGGGSIGPTLLGVAPTYSVASGTGGTSDSMAGADGWIKMTFFTIADGACGTAAGVATALAPAANLCSAGTSGAVSVLNNSWGWSCAGTGGGTNASCTAPFAATNGGGGTVGAIQVTNPGGTTWQIRTADSGFVALPAPAPAGVTMPSGATKVVLDTGAVGTSTTVVLRFSNIPAGAQLYKYGKETGAGDTNKWFPFPATIDRAAGTVTYTLTDGQKGDNDWTANGVIDDPVGLGVGAGGGVEGVPTLSQWAMLLMGSLMALGAWLTLRRSAKFRIN